MLLNLGPAFYGSYSFLVMSKKLNFHHVPAHFADHEDDEARTTRGPAPILNPRNAKHTRLNHDISPNARSYYHEYVPSPAKVPLEPQLWDNSPADDMAPPIDTAYIHHCDTVDVEPNPRLYTQAVSVQIMNMRA